MRYRTKLLACFVGLAAATNAVFLLVQYSQVRAQLRHQIESQVLSIASTAACSVDGDRLAALVSHGRQDSDDYRTLERALRVQRDANRRSDVHVKFIYTMHRDPAEPHVIRFGVDAEEDGPDKSRLGDAYDVPDNFRFDLDAPYVLPEFSTDAWGTWCTAQAPIRDREGRRVGLLAVDVAAHDVVHAQHRLLLCGAVSIGVAMVLAVVVSSLLATRVSRPLALVRDAVRTIARGRFDRVLHVGGKDEFGEVAHAINDMAVGLLQRENLKGALARYVSEEVTQEVLDHGGVRLEGERRRVTVLFADLRGFTSLSERAAPEDVVAMLNDFYAGMIDAVMRHHGLINKFLGDGLMAMFGAPREDDEQEVHAVAAALDMQRAMAMLRERWHEMSGGFGDAELEMGIGVHAGEAVVGNVGSSERVEYTAIGDTVNLASRLESKTKEIPGVQVLVTEPVYRVTRERYAFRAVGEVQIRGRVQPEQAFAPIEIGVSRRAAAESENVIPAS